MCVCVKDVPALCMERRFLPDFFLKPSRQGFCLRVFGNIFGVVVVICEAWVKSVCSLSFFKCFLICYACFDLCTYCWHYFWVITVSFCTIKFHVIYMLLSLSLSFSLEISIYTSNDLCTDWWHYLLVSTVIFWNIEFESDGYHKVEK